MESAGNSAEVDRLSALPTPLLQDILSLLPTKDAVKACSLSKRWEGIWTSIHSLDFDDEGRDDKDPFPPVRPWSSDDEVEPQQQEKTQFPDFVDRVLVGRDGSNLRKFRLRFDIAKWGGRCVDEWVGYAVTHSVQQIELCLWEREPRFLTPFEPVLWAWIFTSSKSVQDHLPRKLFTCESLVDMNLGVQDGHLQLPTSINLPNLQSLELTALMVAGESVQQLLCCCPRLKIFNLTKCNLPDAEIFDVSGCSCLESLILKKNVLRRIKMINISGPELKSLTIVTIQNYVLSLYSHSLNIFCIENLPNLLNATISWDSVHDSSDEGILSWLGLLKGLEHVRTMRLRRSSMEILSRVADLQLCLGTSFTNLKFLELLIGEVRVHEFKAIVWLLKCCPSIETLILEINGDIKVGDMESDYFPYSDYSPYECKLYNLKEVDLRVSEGSNIKHQLLQKLALVLEKVIITAPNTDQQRRKKFRWKELVTRPRASLKFSILSS